MFKLAFTNLACPNWAITHVADEARRMGYDGVELRLLNGEVIDPFADQSALRAGVAACRERGIEICALETSCCLNRADDEGRRQLEALRRWIERAGELDAPVLRVFGGEGPAGMSSADAVKRVAEALAQATPEAEQAGVSICLETHDVFSSARRVAEVLDRVPSPAVAALWDSHHPYRSGEGAEEVGVLLDGRIAHVHVKDARRTGEDDWELTLLGEGEVPVADQLRTLDRLLYRGYVSVEWEKRWNPGLPGPEVALPQHINWLKRWMALERQS